MDYKDEIGKAIVDVSNDKPKDFLDKIEAVMQHKLKKEISVAVKKEEEKIFKKSK
jgi:hypothetical protein